MTKRISSSLRRISTICFQLKQMNGDDQKKESILLPDAIPERNCTEAEKCSPQAQGDYSIFRFPRKGFILAERMKRTRPDYVACYEDETHSASWINGHWYLYENIPGGKTHQYIGRITEAGLRSGKIRTPYQGQKPMTPAAEPICLRPLNVTICEYGFSKAVLDLCPDSWKKLVGKHWKDVLIEIIVGQSPHSYLGAERCSSRARVNIGNHRRSLQKQIGIPLDELWNMLGNIFWIRSETNGYSSLSEAQKAFCQDHHICLEVIS